MKINHQELVSILRLTVNAASNEQEISEVLESLKCSSSISVAIMKSLISLNQPVNPRETAKDLIPILNTIEKDAHNLFIETHIYPIY